MNAIFIHIGTELPECLFDSLYQTLLINEYKTKIYVIIDDSTIDTFNSKVSEFSFNHYTKSKFDYLNLFYQYSDPLHLVIISRFDHLYH